MNSLTGASKAHQETSTGPITQMLCELETQTRCVDNAISDLEQRLSVVLAPSQLLPGGGPAPDPAKSSHSQMYDQIRRYTENLQAFACRINNIRERVEF
jgi:hypothetical protein